MGSLGTRCSRQVRSVRPVVGLVLAFGVGAALVAPGPAAALTRGERADRAIGFIASQQAPNGSFPAFSPVGSTADAVLALVAAGEGAEHVDRALAFLGRRVSAGDAVGIGLQAKVVLAAVAAGTNPATFGGEDLVSAIRDAEQPDGRLGAETAVFDHALGVLALVAAGIAPSAATQDWLAAAQCADGGWQYDAPAGPGDDAHCQDQADPAGDFFLSDTNTTAIAVQALEAAGGSADAAVDPASFFAAIRDASHGGWGYTWGFETTDANSTALVIQAFAALDQSPPAGARGALRALQYRRCGAFAFTWVDGDGGEVRSAPDLGATIGGVLGLLGEALPIEAAEVSEPAPTARACPG